MCPSTIGHFGWRDSDGDGIPDTLDTDQTFAWRHLSPISGHPLGADFDCFGPGYEAKFTVVGDFDGDGRDEIAIAINASGSGGNDFWVMDFNLRNRNWEHLSPISGHPLGADFDCFGPGYEAKFAVTGDFDGDGRDEIAIAINTSGSGGNDFWVMDFNPDTGTWNHLSQDSSHPLGADFDCFGPGYEAKFAVTGDFDGDGRDEVAIAINASGSGGNDFWVMDFNPDAGTWNHLSQDSGHPLGADFDCFGPGYEAKFAVARDFDGDGRDEIAIAINTSGSGGNDFWVMDFNPDAGTWNHLSQDSSHPLGADFDCFGPGYEAKFAVAGDFDGDGRDEIAIAINASGSGGNDFWVMDFNPDAGTWNHLSQDSGHPLGADFDCFGPGYEAKFAVAGDFDGDGRDEVAIAINASGSGGNDFWVMDFNPDAGTWNHLSQDSGHPLGADFDCFGPGYEAKFAVVGNFDADGHDEMAIAINTSGSGGNDFWVMDYAPQ
ncbi:FG-GAP-like repeat-containing protein [Bacillus sp. A260]|uniref:FG-GAP-like repeat-containing protein n=1 Tax=Bacillus sp. A260 TaxID=2660750 RepID=UPI001331526F|nr:FG-GAP-like repeat-containing protein [Bacillus sp. A260]